MKPRAVSVTLLIALVVGGCVGSSPLRYYTLNAPTGAPPPAAGLRISVGPLTLPESVDRPQMVVSVDTNQVKVLDAHRWSAPLKREIPRVLALHLAQLVPGAQFVADTQSAALDAQARLLLDVQRFDSAPGQAARIDLLWTLKDRDGARLANGNASASEALPVDDYEAIAAAHSRLLERIAGQISAALRPLVAGAR